MTVYNWSEMTPRERDALVAEKVMGWTNIHEMKLYHCDGIETVGTLPPTRGTMIIPHYTTEISAAWGVIDNMGKRDWMLYNLFHTLNDDHKPDKYGCCFHQIWTGASRTARSESVNEAICLAALRAVGVDIQ